MQELRTLLTTRRDRDEAWEAAETAAAVLRSLGQTDRYGVAPPTLNRSTGVYEVYVVDRG